MRHVARINPSPTFANVTVLGFHYSQLKRGGFIASRADLFQIFSASGIIITLFHFYRLPADIHNVDLANAFGVFDRFFKLVHLAFCII
jgi:hypothetical protein